MLVFRALSGQVLMDKFQLIKLEDMDKVLEWVLVSTCIIDLCCSWLIMSSWDGTVGWALKVINTFLREVQWSQTVWKVSVRPLLKKLFLNSEYLNSYWLVEIAPFLCKVLEWVGNDQLQALWDETNCLDPFQWGVTPSIDTWYHFGFHVWWLMSGEA